MPGIDSDFVDLTVYWPYNDWPVYGCSKETLSSQLRFFVSDVLVPVGFHS